MIQRKVGLLKIPRIYYPQHQLNLLDMLIIGVVSEKLFVNRRGIVVFTLAGKLVGNIEQMLARQNLPAIE